VSGSDRESDASPRAAGLRERLRRWRLDRIASPGFQRWATRHWLTRGRARRDAERLWDLVSGFVASQVLLACAELNVFETLRQEPQSADALALRHGIASARMATLCRAGAALGLLTRRKDGVYDLGDLGAAALGVPGLLEMIRHNAVVYRDLTDPVALLRGETAPELARFWSYVHGGDVDPDSARTYSRLMAASQALVAEETLDSLDLSNVRHLADLGGGTGRFLAHVADRHPDLALTLMDLPGVIESARPLLDEAGLGARIVCHPGNFLDEPLPRQADAISLVRVLYDHDDEIENEVLCWRMLRDAEGMLALLLNGESKGLRLRITGRDKHPLLCGAPGLPI